MNNNGIIIALLTILIMVGIYFVVEKNKAAPAPTIIKETVVEKVPAEPEDGSSVDFKMSRKIKL